MNKGGDGTERESLFDSVLLVVLWKSNGFALSPRSHSLSLPLRPLPIFQQWNKKRFQHLFLSLSPLLIKVEGYFRQLQQDEWVSFSVLSLQFAVICLFGFLQGAKFPL